MKWTVLPTIAFGLISGGCADISSEDIRTSGICATITASNDSNNKVNIYAELTAGCGLGGSYVVLGSGESLTTSYQNQSYTLSRHTYILNVTSYSATTSSDFVAGQKVAVALNRPDGYTDAPNSYVTLPSSFTMSSPANDASYALGDTMTVDWTRTTSDQVYFAFNCVEDVTNDSVMVNIMTIPNTAPYIVPISSLDSEINDGSRLNHISKCTGTVSVIRFQNGVVDPALDPDSRIYGKFKLSRSIRLSL